MSDEMKVNLDKNSSVDKMKVREGVDGYSYPYTSPDLVVDKMENLLLPNLLN